MWAHSCKVEVAEERSWLYPGVLLHGRGGGARYCWLWGVCTGVEAKEEAAGVRLFGCAWLGCRGGG